LQLFLIYKNAKVETNGRNMLKAFMNSIHSIPLPINEQRQGWPWTEGVNPNIYASRKKWPKISIITPSYNQGQYIEETILSVINQGYPNLEYIIIDGGSTDDTVNIIKKYEKDLTYWVSEPDRGQSHAINKGLSVATGELFNWLNSDDLLAEDSLFTIGSCFAEEQTNVLCGFCNQFEGVISNTMYHYQMGICKSAEETIVAHGMNQPATFYKLEIVRSLGGINESLLYVMDLELWFKYLLTYGLENIKVSNKTLAHFRLHKESKSVGQISKMVLEESRLYYTLFSQTPICKIILDHFSSSSLVKDHRQVLNVNFKVPAKNLLKLGEFLSLHYIRQHYKNGKFTGSPKVVLYHLIQYHPSFNRHWLKLFLNAYLQQIPIVWLFQKMKRVVRSLLGMKIK
jgi:glycosyltransferase involved in cell wall biosynthesis